MISNQYTIDRDIKLICEKLGWDTSRIVEKCVGVVQLFETEPIDIWNTEDELLAYLQKCRVSVDHASLSEI